MFVSNSVAFSSLVADVAPAAPQRTEDRYQGDPVARQGAGYDVVEGASDEDAWNLTDRE